MLYFFLHLYWGEYSTYHLEEMNLRKLFFHALNVKIIYFYLNDIFNKHRTYDFSRILLLNFLKFFVKYSPPYEFENDNRRKGLLQK